MKREQLMLSYFYYFYSRKEKDACGFSIPVAKIICLVWILFTMMGLSAFDHSLYKITLKDAFMYVQTTYNTHISGAETT